MLRRSVSVSIATLLCCGLGAALEPGTDVWVPAAARNDSWVTDLYVLNPGADAVHVELYWLQRDRDNGDAAPLHFTVGGEATLDLPDVIQETFGRSSGLGAFRVVADSKVVVTCRIYDTAGGAGTRGQGFEGVPLAAAVSAGSSTHITGLSQGPAFRSNLFAVNTQSSETQLRFVQLAADGTVVATSSTYELPPFAALYVPVIDIGGPSFDFGSVRVEVDAGSAVVAGSKVDQVSLDPTTLEAWWQATGDPAGGSFAGTYFGTAADRTGFLGGIVLEIDDDEAAYRLDFTFPSVSCGLTLAGGEILNPPRALTDFVDGISFTDGYATGGTMSWTLRFDSLLDPTLLEGTLEAVGTGFSGDLSSCNGPHPAVMVRLGRDIP